MAACGELRRTVGDPGGGRPQIGAQREHVRSLPAASTATSSGGHNGKRLPPPPPPPRLRPAIASSRSRSRVSFRRGFLEARGGKKGEKEKRTLLPAMATMAAAYGCPAAAAAPFAASVSRRRAPPSRVSFASSSSSRRRTAEFPGLRVSCRRRILAVSACSGEADSDAAASPAESTFDLNLPRRSLLVQFTCNACGERTKRLINRVAYERGTIFLQCAGCQVYHKFVDNLGLADRSVTRRL
uniref:DNL-type domain-containing protein n=1 Tax=Oryza meridionalis TaxID=40149 RepID=A0A0E0C4F4_9ORYZ